RGRNSPPPTPMRPAAAPMAMPDTRPREPPRASEISCPPCLDSLWSSREMELVAYAISIAVGRDKFAVIAGAQGPHHIEVDRVLDELDRAVQEQEVAAPGMLGVERCRARVRPVDCVLAAVDDDGRNRRTRVLAAQAPGRVVDDLGVRQDAHPATQDEAVVP